MENQEKETLIFSDGELSLSVQFSFEEETVLLTAIQMAELFERDAKTIRKHINNVFSDGELDKKSNTQKMRTAISDKPVDFYSLDVIISVGYRVKSQRGVLFRKWATSILKQYMLNGAAINKKRLCVLNKVISIQSGIIANQLHIEKEAVHKVIN